MFQFDATPLVYFLLLLPTLLASYPKVIAKTKVRKFSLYILDFYGLGLLHSNLYRVDFGLWCEVRV